MGSVNEILLRLIIGGGGEEGLGGLVAQSVVSRDLGEERDGDDEEDGGSSSGGRGGEGW